MTSMTLTTIRAMRAVLFFDELPDVSKSDESKVPVDEVAAQEDWEAGAAVEVKGVCLARFRNAWKLFGPDSTAFAEKTIPSAQWLVCLQYTQMGFVSLTRTVKVGKVVALEETGLNPESNPGTPVTASCFVQG